MPRMTGSSAGTVSSAVRSALGPRRRAEGRVADGHDSLVDKVGEELGLLEVRMKLHLVWLRQNARIAEEPNSILGMVMFEVPMWRTSPLSTSSSSLRQVRMYRS